MNLTIAWITARALLGRRRVLLLLPFPVLVVGLTLIAHAIKPDAASDWAEPIIDHLGFGVMVPVIALIVGTAVLGAEIEDGTIVHILAKPLPRREIILAKLAVAAAIIATVAAVLHAAGREELGAGAGGEGTHRGVPDPPRRLAVRRPFDR